MLTTKVVHSCEQGNGIYGTKEAEKLLSNWATVSLSRKTLLEELKKQDTVLL